MSQSNNNLNDIKNIYLMEVKSNLPRILSLIDIDKTNKSFGTTDRLHWGWKLKDFANGTGQGMINGFCRLWINNLWPYETSKEKFIKRISYLIDGAKNLTRNDGSLEEAFPFESSYCVTALVAFDHLVAYELIKNEISIELKEKWLKTIKIWIYFLITSEETHAFISNHLATAAAALLRWSIVEKKTSLGEKAFQHGRKIIRKILDNQSCNDFFYKEYDGPDPGYQSLCINYLTDAFLTIEKIGLISDSLKDELMISLNKSIIYLSYFFHPDGSFGGMYGSRNTRFFSPGGLEYMSKYDPNSYALTNRIKESLKSNKVVSLSSLDFGNLIPFFNSYCWAATVLEENIKNNQEHKSDTKYYPRLPCERIEKFRKIFKDSGIIIDSSKNHYTIISAKKGGVLMHFKNNKLIIQDLGILLKDKKNKLYSNQIWNESNKIHLKNNKLTINSYFAKLNKQLPNPYNYLILRFMNISIMRFKLLRELAKKKLAKFLIMNKNIKKAINTRTIILGEEIKISDSQIGISKKDTLIKGENFSAIHMASQGYWQIQDEQT
tara:strand:+ start:2549 stop:4198 length:1650 start_codon:yes stop_codon:yes gene_type:complete